MGNVEEKEDPGTIQEELFHTGCLSKTALPLSIVEVDQETWK
jgi:hypothetical protein